MREAVSCFDDDFVRAEGGFSVAARAEPCVEMASIGKESALHLAMRAARGIVVESFFDGAPELGFV